MLLMCQCKKIVFFNGLLVVLLVCVDKGFMMIKEFVIVFVYLVVGYDCIVYFI